MKTQAASQPRRAAAPAKSSTLNRRKQSKRDPGLRAVLSAPEPAEFTKLTQQVKGEASERKKHPPPQRKRDEMQKAAALEPVEQNEQSSKEKSSQALVNATPALNNAKARFNPERFKADFVLLMANQKPPEDAGEVKRYAEDSPVQKFPDTLSGDMARQQGDIVKPLREQTTKLPPPDPAKKAVDVPKPGGPSTATSPEARLARPPRRNDWPTWLPAHHNTIDRAMQAQRLTDGQLAESREPTFINALQAKQQAQREINAAPATYQAREAAVQQTSEENASHLLGSQLAGMNKLNRLASGGVFGSQKKSETKTEKRQREIKGEIDRIYKRTVGSVEQILKEMADAVKSGFSQAIDRQSKEFNRRVRKLIDKYYGWTTWDDKLFGPADVVVLPNGKTRKLTLEEKFGMAKAPGKTINPDVYDIFVREKANFVQAMEGELDTIAARIETGLTDATTAIQLGETDIARFKSTLSGDELDYANKLEADVKMRFQNLQGTIDDARDDLLSELADQYRDAAAQLETSFHEINDELKKSFIDRAVEFIETVGSTIAQLASLLFSILKRVAHLVWDIIQHPIRFFSTLVEGIGRGVGQFIDGFSTYLQEGFWTWISNTTSSRGVQLSGTSGTDTLFSVVVQLLNLGQPQLRSIASEVFGKPVMDQIDRVLTLGEKALEPLELLFTKGPLAVWDRMRETLGDLVQSTFERIKESVFYGLIRKALKWIAGFFVPGGGFVKVIQAIFRAFQFVADNLQRIRAFFDSVFDAMQEALDGRSEGVAAKVLQGLKLGIVLALDFLAKQLGLGSLIDDVHKIIDSLRRPIIRAITWLLTQIKPVVLRVVDSVVKLGKGAVSVGKAAIEKVRKWWAARKPFTSEEGEAHTLYFDGSETGARLMIQSKPQPYATFIDDVKDPRTERGKAAKTEALQIAAELDKVVKAAANRGRTEAEIAKTPPEQAGLRADPSAEINDLLDRLAAATARFMPEGSGESSPPLFGPLVHGFGSSVRVAQLTKQHKAGSGPGVDGGDWEPLRRRMDGGGSYYVRGHLLNDNIGGSGKTWENLTPLTQKANNRATDSMLHAFETPVKDKVAKRGTRVSFFVTANYARKHKLASWIPDLTGSENPDDRVIGEIIRAEQHVPRNIVGEVHDVEPDGKKTNLVVRHTVNNDIDDGSVDDYQLTAEPIKSFYINDHLVNKRTAVELLKLGIEQGVIDALLENKPPGGYRTVEQLERYGLDWEAARATKGLRVRIYRREG